MFEFVRFDLSQTGSVAPPRLVQRLDVDAEGGDGYVVQVVVGPPAVAGDVGIVGIAVGIAGHRGIEEAGTVVHDSGTAIAECRSPRTVSGRRQPQPVAAINHSSVVVDVFCAVVVRYCHLPRRKIVLSFTRILYDSSNIV